MALSPRKKVTKGKKRTVGRSGGALQSRSLEFKLVDKYPLGYRNREDITNLPPGVLVVGSQNVLTGVGDRVRAREGYTLDGEENTNLGGINASYDWFMHNGVEQHLRGNSYAGTLEFRYVDADGNVTWNTLISGLSSTAFNFAEFWDFSTELKSLLLMVNGSASITEWTGGVTTVASVTTNTITKEGTDTWAQLGFYSNASNSAKFQLVSPGGITYTYTGGAGTQTLTGVTPDPTLDASLTAGAMVYQPTVTTANGSMTGLPSSEFTNDLISNLKNQIYLGCLTNASVYVSKVNNYKDYSFASPRAVGEGAILTLDTPPKALVPQEDQMYISAGKDFWYVTKFTLSSDNADEALQIERLKTSKLLGATSQAATTKIDNSIVFLSYEPIINSLGRVENVLQTPQIENMSDSIKLDIDSYDTTDVAIAYNRYFIYISFPVNGVVRIFNRITKYWEAPQLLPIGRFSIIDGLIYGHDYNVPQTYKLFDGFNDNGNPINAIAAFSYENAGIPAEKKNTNMYYTEGYISSNSTLYLTLKYDFGGFTSTTSYSISGADQTLLFYTITDGSLGKNPLGSNPLGSITDSVTGLPKFRVINTFTRQDYYEYQPYYSSNDIDQQWEIIRFGGAQQISGAINTEIRK